MELLNPKTGDPRKPAPPLVEPTPRSSPTWQLVTEMLASSGLLTADVLKQFDKGGKEFNAELAKLKGFSHTDARAEFKAMMQELLDGKRDAKAMPTSDEVIRKNTLIRRAVKHRASEVSRKYCLLAAGILEASLEHIPAFTKKLLAAEAALSSVSGQLAASPLRQVCSELPALVKFHAKKYREREQPMVNPSQLFNS